MIDWLSIPKNFKWINGSLAQESAVVAGNKLTKTTAYKAMADHVNLVCGTDWIGSTGKSRFESYLKTYKKAVKDSSQS